VVLPPSPPAETALVNLDHQHLVPEGNQQPTLPLPSPTPSPTLTSPTPPSPTFSLTPTLQPDAAGRHRIEALFVKRRLDMGIDVHREGELMLHIIEEYGGASWELNIHPQPTLKHFLGCIKRAQERNTRVMHLSGHGNQDEGFIWNADDAASEKTVVDMDVIAKAIGRVAGSQGPVECASLNACWTHAMGLKLREHGVPHVVCWRTPVQDPIARAFCALFLLSLVRQKDGTRDYRRAFEKAADEMRDPAHRSEADGHGPADVNVVQLLSIDGDIQPVYLQRQPSDDDEGSDDDDEGGDEDPQPVSQAAANVSQASAVANACEAAAAVLAFGSLAAALLSKRD